MVLEAGAIVIMVSGGTKVNECLVIGWIKFH